MTNSTGYRKLAHARKSAEVDVRQFSDGKLSFVYPK